VPPIKDVDWTMRKKPVQRALRSGAAFEEQGVDGRPGLGQVGGSCCKGLACASVSPVNVGLWTVKTDGITSRASLHIVQA